MDALTWLRSQLETDGDDLPGETVFSFAEEITGVSSIMYDASDRASNG